MPATERDVVVVVVVMVILYSCHALSLRSRHCYLINTLLRNSHGGSNSDSNSDITTMTIRQVSETLSSWARWSLLLIVVFYHCWSLFFIIVRRCFASLFASLFCFVWYFTTCGHHSLLTPHDGQCCFARLLLPSLHSSNIGRCSFA